MKKLFLLLVLLSSAAWADALTDNADSEWASIQPNVVASQNAYNVSKHLFWQGLQWFSNVPASVTPAAPNKWSGVHPGYENADWGTFYGAPSGPNSAYSLQIDQYQGPQGNGWQADLYVVDAGTTMVRTINFGPETGRDQGWTATKTGL